jgi:RNA-binding protein Musashi
VDACTIMRDPDGRSRGFAFLTFDEPESVNAVTGREHILDGKAVSVSLANSLILLMCQ